MTVRLDYSKRILALVTGTGYGIGRAITMALANRLVSGSMLVGITKVNDIPNKIQALNEMKAKNPEVYFHVDMKDLSTVDFGVYTSIVDKFIVHPPVRERHYKYGLIVHNAGSLGGVEPTTNLQNVDTWRNYYNLNFFSPTLLNTIFITKCKPYMEHIFVVNMSSIFSVRPQPNLSMYCSAKAARNMYFSCLAAEDADVSVMNYSPGAVETSMLGELHVKQPASKDSLKTLTPDETACKMLDTLTTGNYISGKLFDYYGRTA